MTSTSWHSYPKIYSMGHSAIKELFSDSVHAEEKVDGSQFSFGLFEDGLKIRSKGVQMNIDAPEKMFNKAIETVKEIQSKLVYGWTYRAEYLQKPKHNVLAYDRVPEKNLIIFDINVGEESYLSYEEKRIEANRIGLECIPKLFDGKIETPEHFLSLLNKTSCLGGQNIEGVVIKNYSRFGVDKKCLMGKHVSEAFKEKHKVDWSVSNPTKSDVVQTLINSYRTGARWDKAIIHLKEKGELENSPKDIGKLILETKADLEIECKEEIKELLFQWAFPKIARAVAGGLPEYYKEHLVKNQFLESLI